jgi:uncharacterized protein (TIGR03032 family)
VSATRESLWDRHDTAWRDPAQVVSQWSEAASVDPKLLRTRIEGAWWDVLEELDCTLLVSREYEHLLVGFSPDRRVTYAPVPHPSGIAVDGRRGLVHVASTRNPNQVYDLVPLDEPGRPLVPVRSRFLPGALYLHDLALVGGQLHGSAVGHNAVVRLPERGGYEHVWWPRLVDVDGGPDTSANYIQLNSIAGGETVETSFYSASAERISARRPGHRNFPVDRRGVVFSGATREPLARGLTRPHSARLHDGRLWVDDSGYGAVGVVEDGRFAEVARLGSWTRGLLLRDRFAFVGLSRVIPRFRSYAPGLDVDRSVCGVAVVDVRSGEVHGRCVWPYGNQVFAVEAVPADLSGGLPFPRSRGDAVRLFSRLDVRSGG